MAYAVDDTAAGPGGKPPSNSSPPHRRPEGSRSAPEQRTTLRELGIEGASLGAYPVASLTPHGPTRRIPPTQPTPPRPRRRPRRHRSRRSQRTRNEPLAANASAPPRKHGHPTHPAQPTPTPRSTPTTPPHPTPTAVAHTQTHPTSVRETVSTGPFAGIRHEPAFGQGSGSLGRETERGLASRGLEGEGALLPADARPWAVASWPWAVASWPWPCRRLSGRAPSPRHQMHPDQIAAARLGETPWSLRAVTDSNHC